MKSTRGITLVSLVVTIIVLIILAGVSINLTLGENGIITMAKRARENMELAKVDEERQLNELYMQMEQEDLSGGISYDAISKLVEFKREIASAITDMGIDTPENADASTMSNNIRSILGTATAEKVTYDNTNSNLAATNVQGAVDEIDNEVDELSDSLTRIDISDKFTISNGTIHKKKFCYIPALKVVYYDIVLTNCTIQQATWTHIGTIDDSKYYPSTMIHGEYIQNHNVFEVTSSSPINKIMFSGIRNDEFSKKISAILGDALNNGQFRTNGFYFVD